VKLFKYFFLAGIISCFIGEAITIRVFDLLVLFPIRVFVILALPIILAKPLNKKKGILGYASRLLIFMIIYGLVSLIWSPDPNLGLRIFFMLLMGTLTFLFFSKNAIDELVLRKIMIVWSLMTILISFLAFYEMASGQYLFTNVTDFGATDIEENRIKNIGWLTPRVFFQGPNEFAFFNGISALVLLGWSFESKGRLRLIAIIATVLATILIINSFSRASIFGFILGLIVFIYVLTTKAKLIYRIATFFFILCVCIFAYFEWGNLVNNNLAFSALAYKINNDENTLRQFFYYTAFSEGTIGSFGFGRGLGASSKIILGSSYHQGLLEILAELGLYFFIGYLILFAKVVKQLWSSIKQRRNTYWSCGLLASCFAFPFFSSGPASTIFIYPYWLWLSLIVSYSEYDSKILNINKSSEYINIKKANF
jgi:hypothetical protein